MRAWAFLVVLAASPAAADLSPANCLTPAPADFQALRACQTKSRAAAVTATARMSGPLAALELDRFDEAQRAEARQFMAKPGNVVTAPAKKPGGASTEKLLAAMAANLMRVDPKSRDVIAGLQARLLSAAGDGKDGITPGMSDDISATLMQSQGGISPEMKTLLDAVTHDGGNLTPDTMLKLQNGAQKAKGEGLDLGIDPKLEKELLNHDFESDKPAFNAAQPPPGTM